MPRGALQPRDAGGALQGQVHRRGARHADRGGRRLLRGDSGHLPAPAHPRRGGARLRAAGSAGADPVRRRGAARQARPRAPGAARAPAPRRGGGAGRRAGRRPAPALSGGEAERVKLASELQKRSTGSTVYVLDEPTTGLHFEDTRRLLGVLQSLVDKGNTVIVIEHNLDVIKTADWLVDMGPEGGTRGGMVVAEGTPEAVAAHPDSFTGQFLRPLLNVDPPEARPRAKRQSTRQRPTAAAT